ncbi:hypothetical protein [Bacillus thuringiensis]|uniref:hypothetical protein n=1 Tax=Bacillus thuringiensis TaxID=1428 RepID=UPI000BF88623|nr:hypothetical protein [Bacillus thuringiensis]PFN58495.1 hypothetical protein COJ75_16845 [Bacillus thuringiensis]
MVEILGFVAILSLSLLLTVIIMVQDYYLTNIKEGYDKNIIAIAIVSMRVLSGIWVIFVTETNITAVLKAIAIQLIVLLFLWLFSKYVQKHKENWFITIVAFITYGIGSYFYIMFTFID